MIEKDPIFDPDEIFKKLEAVCRKLWDEDRVSAVALQAVSNEVTSGFSRAGEIIASLHHELQVKESVLRNEYDMKLREAGEKLAAALARTAGVEEEWCRAKLKVNALLKELEAKEEENSGFQEKHLRIEAQKDSERAAHMEKFIEEENAREHERELFWEQRNRELEAEFKRLEHELQTRYREALEEARRSAEETGKLLSQKEAKLLEARKQMEEEYRVREAALSERGKDYAKKCEEMEALKRNLRAEIGELTREYPRGGRAGPESK